VAILTRELKTKEAKEPSLRSDPCLDKRLSLFFLTNQVGDPPIILTTKKIEIGQTTTLERVPMYMRVLSKSEPNNQCSVFVTIHTVAS